MGALLGLLLGCGLLLVWLVLSGPAGVADRARARPRARVTMMLRRAGADQVTPAALLAMAAVVGVLVGLAMLAVSGVGSVAMAFGSVAAYGPVALMRGRARRALGERAEVWPDVPDDVAEQVAVLPAAYAALAIVEVARRLDRDPLEVARVHGVVGQELEIDVLYDRVVELPRADRWQTMARAALRDDLQQVHAALTATVLEHSPTGAAGGASETSEASEASDAGDSGQDPEQRAAEQQVAAWAAHAAERLERARATLHEICRDEAPDLARMSVGLRVARSLLD